MERLKVLVVLHSDILIQAINLTFVPSSTVEHPFSAQQLLIQHG